VAEVIEQAVAAAPPVLTGTDHIELWVGNARQAAQFYRGTFGFDVIAYAGPETGLRDRASYVLEQGGVRLVLTAPLQPEGELAAHVHRHGDGVRTIALRVEDATAAFEAALARGARAVEEPRTVEDSHGALRYAGIATFGDTIHRFVERDEYAGPHWPGYRAEHRSGGGVGLRHIDHTVGNVELGAMDSWVDFYREVFGFHVFQEFDEQDIATRYSALRSKVTRDQRTWITFPINEPAEGLRASQIQEYLDYYGGAGVQHIALHTDDIIESVFAMRERGVEFLTAPSAYYEEIAGRVRDHGVSEDLDRLRELSVLVDFEDDGYLLQIFTRPVADRPTLFFEVIQRKGAKGFGKGNFKALFEAIEREQAARGNL
jgi:4-hydroxyphenylpyruvate dioxygenase